MSQVNQLASDPWDVVLDMLKELMPPVSFETWIKPLQIMLMQDRRMVLGIGEQFIAETLKKRYSGLINNAVKQAYGREYDIEIVNKYTFNVATGQSESETTQSDGMLNPRYTFSTFVVGNSNRFAHAASLAVAELPSDAYNPLFLYGGVGLGKTHLMHAIGHYIQSENPDAKVLYITSESFTNELIAAIASKTNRELREKLRNVDVLMVDDIQFIAGKNATQEEFFHTFNHLHGGGKQIIISSDRPPKDIPTLEERLRSRFEWGLIADIQKPDYETRLAILRRKAEGEHIEIGDDVLALIAEKVESNIRELEGSLIRVNAEAQLKGELPITKQMAEASLMAIMGDRDPRRITPELIMQQVAEYYHIDVAEMMSAKRNRKISMPRQVAMYLTRDLTQLSTTRIGDFFGGRDHTTVMHACEKIGAEVKTDQQVMRAIESIRVSLNEK